MRKLLVSLLLIFSALPLIAGGWKRAGLYGADVRSLIADPQAPDTLYLGTSNGDLYVSHDAAATWKRPRVGIPFPGYIVDQLMIDRSGRLWAGCWGLWGGGVVAFSEDGGVTWTRRDHGIEELSLRALAIDPHDENFLVAGGLTGIYKSLDGGLSWKKISEQENVESLAIDPASHDRIYAGTWRQGIRSEDGGQSWKLINNGMVLDTDMFAISIERDHPESVWVATCGWVYNSTNGGDLWTRYRDGFNNRRIHDVQVDPCDRNVVYAGSVAGLYRSHDRGKNWYAVSDEGLVIKSIVLHPQRPGRVIVGIEGDGVYVSNDEAKTFARSCTGLQNLRITSIATDPTMQHRVFASVVFGGTASGLYQSDDDGDHWTKISAPDMPHVLSVSVAGDPQFPKFVAGTERGFFFSNDGHDWTQSPPVNVPIRVDKILRFSANRYFAATSEGVFTSKDGGRGWYRLAGADNGTVDISLGSLGDRRALFALTTLGLMAFDGAEWSAIAGAPEKGRTVAVRGSGDQQVVFVAGAAGVKAGKVAADRRWYPVEAPDSHYASVIGVYRDQAPLLFLTSRQQHDVLMSDATANEWLAFSLPSRTAEVTTVMPDPFDPHHVYVGTMGEGVYVYDGPIHKFVPEPEVPHTVSTN